ncbi:hypothetical protein [Myceligenerans crystallogenes]|uniref:Uncharacterized protein n=1 Tax=Myceligenerans crystallogenes TaxID=316335 RepID=A0ABN2NFR8_9MICO
MNTNLTDSAPWAAHRPADLWSEAAVDAALDTLRDALLTASRRTSDDDDMPGADAHLRSAHDHENA